MTTQPTRFEYDLGSDRYQRRTKLIGERQNGNGNGIVWQIVSEPVNQRDDGEHVRSLTTSQLIAAGKIASEAR